jgi:translation initiation factor IF-3
VCRVLDYSKYKYEQSQKQKAARKHQQQITIREIKFRPKIAEQDYATKKRHVERFLKHKDKVKITIMFRGREVTHPERGQMILDRLAEELTELAIIEQRPNLDGRNMTMLLGPSKAVLAGRWARTARTAPSRRPRASVRGDGLRQSPRRAMRRAGRGRRGRAVAPTSAAEAADEPGRRARRRRARGLAPRRSVLAVRDRLAHVSRRAERAAARRRTRAPRRPASRPPRRA